MTTVKVYKYQWTHWDFLKDVDQQRISEIYVTIKHIKKKSEEHPRRQYAIIPDSELIVDKNQVVHGIFHPDLTSALDNPPNSELD